MQIAHVYGAGKLGRGFVAPLLNRRCLMYFFDTSIERRMALDDRWFPIIWKRGTQIISPVVCGDPSQVGDCREPDIIVTCVGPNGFPSLVQHFLEVKPIAPILTLENDPKAAGKLRDIGLNAFSGIASVSVPDPGNWLYQFHRGAVLGDHFGELFVPIEFLDAYNLQSNVYVPIRTYSNHKRAWAHKILLHLAPHALCAYIGMNRGYDFIHEVMQNMDREIDVAVQPLIENLIDMYGSERAWRNAWEKEVARFSEDHLADSVYRVGRNPRLKVSAGERLMLGLHIAGGALWEEAVSTALHLGYGSGLAESLHDLPVTDEVKARILELGSDAEIPEEFSEYFPEA